MWSILCSCRHPRTTSLCPQLLHLCRLRPNLRAPRSFTAASRVYAALLLLWMWSGFVHPDALEQHRSALHYFTCIDCHRTFVNLGALQQHQESKNHCYCDECNLFFFDSEALGQHLRSSVHAVQFHCCDCDRDFVNEQALHQHLADKIHKPRRKSQVSSFRFCSWVCEHCERKFGDENGLKQHRMSVIHRPLSNIRCVRSRRCGKQFTSPSAWLHHLESGGCPSKMTRDKLRSTIQSSDINQLITGGSIQEYTALMRPDMSETTSITENVILTPNTDDRFNGSQPQPDIWESQSGMLTPNSGSFQNILEDSSLVIRLICPLCPFGQKPWGIICHRQLIHQKYSIVPYILQDWRMIDKSPNWSDISRH